MHISLSKLSFVTLLNVMLKMSWYLIHAPLMIRDTRCICFALQIWHIKRQIFHNRSSHSDLWIYSTSGLERWNLLQPCCSSQPWCLLDISLARIFARLLSRFKRDFVPWKVSKSLANKFLTRNVSLVSWGSNKYWLCLTCALFSEPESSLCPHDNFV